MLSCDWAPMMGPPLTGLGIMPCRMSSRRLPEELQVAQHTENMPGHAARFCEARMVRPPCNQSTRLKSRLQTSLSNETFLISSVST